MELNGRFRVPADRETVWRALSDPEVLRECLPGCQSLEKISPTSARAVVEVEIGAFRAVFTGTIRVDSAAPPGAVALSAEGRGRPAGSAEGRLDATLTAEGHETIVAYSGTARVGGKLGEIAPGLVEGKARELADRFAAALAARIRTAGPDFVDELDHSPANVQLGDEPGEDVVIDKTEKSGQAAENVGHQVEVAAGEGVLGGPAVWSLLAILVLIVFLGILFTA